MKRPAPRNVNMLRLAIGMTGTMAINNHGCELILALQTELNRLGSSFTLRDAAKVSANVEKWNTPQTKTQPKKK